MTTTISYNGSTIATVENQTKTLTTAGTYVPHSFIVTDVTSGAGFTADEIAMRTISGDISGNASYIGDNAFRNCSALTTVSFPSATYISSYAFYNCSALTSANFQNTTYIGSYAFDGCPALTTVSSPKVTNIYTYAFYNCSALTAASFSSATYIASNAFRNCSALTTVSFPNATTISTYAFTGCSALATASFPNVTIISSYAFSGCSKLTTVSFQSATSIGGSAFNNCKSLTTISFPNLTAIGGSAFLSCTSLTTVSFPSVMYVYAYAFASCSALTTTSFPSAINIYASAFADCYSLTTVSFPSAASIGSYAFDRCYNLLSLYLLGSSIPSLGILAFRSTPIGGYTASTGGIYGSIFVPSSLYDQYIVANNWSAYSDRIVGVSASSSSSIPDALVAKFTKRWYDNGVSAATTAASHYYYLPNTPTSSNGSYVTNLTYQIITSSAFIVNIAGKTHFMGEGPCVYLSTALPTDVDYLGSCIFTDPMDSLDESDMTGSFSVSAGNYGNYLTIHTWCEDFSTDFYTIANLATACVSYSGEYYLSKIG